MTTERPLLDTMTAESRRTFLSKIGKATLSAAAIGLIAGTPNLASAYGRKKKKASSAVEADIVILNAAIAAEHQAVAAYQVGAESGLLQKPVLAVAVQFQDHHKAHTQVLVETVTKLGGTPTDPLKSYDFPVNKLKTQANVLEFAAGLERGAVSAYAQAVPKFDNRDLSLAAASILADEAMHWAVLRQALGLDPVPGAFFS